MDSQRRKKERRKKKEEKRKKKRERRKKERIPETCKKPLTKLLQMQAGYAGEVAFV